MNIFQSKVLEFHKKFGFPFNTTPTIIPSNLRRIRENLMSEELQELIAAMNDANIIKIADGLADLLYTVYGTAISYGLDMKPIFYEIHRSNMSKTAVQGVTKGVKGTKYTPPRLRQIIQQLEEKQNAIKETALNIPLWKELYAQFGNELPDSNFWVQLQRITGLDPKDARNNADFVRKAYLDDISHIKSEKEEENMAGQESAEKFDTNPAIPEEAFGRFSLKGVGYVDVTDIDTYGIAEAYMKVLAKKLKIESTIEREEQKTK